MNIYNALNLTLTWLFIYIMISFSKIIFLNIVAVFSPTVCSLGEEVGRLFLQASPHAGIRAGSTRARDSGYDSLHRRLSVLDRLVQTHAVWLQLGLSHQDATLILHNQPAGVSFSIFFISQTFSWIMQHNVFYVMDWWPVQVFQPHLVTPPHIPTPPWFESA